ncbi:MAG: hypothetical protein EXR31_10200 [Betaproteobacteria bacterium]|nr:hypothetical protein [Betaproteobacteria bacterium]
MLAELLKRLLSVSRPPTPTPPPDPARIPHPGTLEHMLWQRFPNAAAPHNLHLHTLFAGLRVGDRDFNDLMQQALAQTSSSIPGVKLVRRHAATWNLIRYFLHARRIPGAWAECGVYSGASALALCLAARAEDPAFDGSGLHLIDSFEGLSSPVGEDAIHTAGEDGAARERPPLIPRGNLRAPIGIVTTAMGEFPGVRITKGWIAEVFAQLPETTWSFVHLDVDLFEPTLASLEYFVPRLAAGGIVVCDDYGALGFPGAARAWDLYFSEPALPYVVLPTGQSVFVAA